MPAPQVHSEVLTDDVIVSINFMLPGQIDAVRDSTPMLSWMLGTLGELVRKTIGQRVPRLKNKSLKKLYPGGPLLDEELQIDKGQPSTEIVGLQKTPAVEEQLLTEAFFKPAFIGRPLSISREAILKASHTNAAKVKLIDSRVQNFKQSQIDKLDSGLNGAAGGVSNAISGFQDVFSNGLYGNVDPAIYPTWKANVDAAPGSFAINGEKAMGTMVRALTINSSRPTIIFAGSNMIGRFDDNISSRVNFESGSIVNLGFEIRNFQGIPLVENKNMPVDSLWYMNDEWVTLFVHENADNKVTGPFGLENAFGVGWSIEWMGQLVVKSRRHFGAQDNWAN